MTMQLALTAPNLGAQVAQLTTMADFLPEAKGKPFVGRLKSYSSLGATQRQAMVEYLFEQLTLAGKLKEAQQAWDRSQAEGVMPPSIEQTASVARNKVQRAEAAIKAATKLNKLHKIIMALAQLASAADVSSIDELVQLIDDELVSYVDKLHNDDYAVIAPFLSLPKRG